MVNLLDAPLGRETSDAATLQGHVERVERMLAGETASPVEADVRDQVARRRAPRWTIDALQVRLRQTQFRSK